MRTMRGSVVERGGGKRTEVRRGVIALGADIGVLAGRMTETSTMIERGIGKGDIGTAETVRGIVIVTGMTGEGVERRTETDVGQGAKSTAENMEGAAVRARDDPPVVRSFHFI